MAFEFRLPDLGEGIEEAQLLSWKVHPGDWVNAFDPLCEVESAKATVELTAPVAGRVRETRVAEGATAHRGEVLVVIEADGADERTSGQGTEGGQRHIEADTGTVGRSEDQWVGIVGAAPAAPHPVSSSPVRAAPFVRKLARDLGVRLEDVVGSGPEGRIRAADVETYAQRSHAPLPEIAGQGARAPAADEERIPLRGLRKRIAEHLVRATRLAPQVTAMDLFDVVELVEARRLLAASAEAEGVRLTYLPFVVKAAVEALRSVPYANAVMDEAEQTLVVKRVYHVGIATAVHDGLVVPVVRHADRLSVLELARAIGCLVEAARAGRARPEDLVGSTFTITSFGGLPGSPLFATPILNHPEVAILGVGRIEEQPRVVNGQVVPRPCLGVSLTFDHRVLDGEAGARLLAALRRYLERPLELLLRLH